MGKVKSIVDIDKNFIQDCIENLENRPYQNEAQFQFALANKILNNTENLFVDIEVSAGMEDTTTKKQFRKNIDIIVSDIVGNYIALELKYKTRDKSKNCDYFEYGEESEKVRIACQGASDLARYSFLYDVYRIELLKNDKISLHDNHKTYKNFIRGFAVIVTNDKNIIVKKYNTNLNVSYALTCIGDDSNTQTDIKFIKTKNKNKDKYPCFTLSKSYKCLWKEFYNDNSNNPEFKYLIIEVN